MAQLKETNKRINILKKENIELKEKINKINNEMSKL